MPRIVNNKSISPSSVQNRLSVWRRPAMAKRRFECRICHQYHALRACPKFLDMNTEKRMRAVLLHKYCANCLAHQHSGNSCRSKIGCHYCKQDHHTMLHMHERLRNSDSVMQPSSTPSKSITVASIIAQHIVPLFPTALVRIQVGSRLHYARSLLDPCVAVSRISHELIKHLGISTTRIGNDHICSIFIRAHSDPHIKLETTLQTSHRISLKTPSKSLDASIKEKFSNVILADPDFDRYAPISLILGADLYQKIIKPGVIPSSNGLPVAQNTIFGWILSGSCAV